MPPEGRSRARLRVLTTRSPSSWSDFALARLAAASTRRSSQQCPRSGPDATHREISTEGPQSRWGLRRGAASSTRTVWRTYRIVDPEAHVLVRLECRQLRETGERVAVPPHPADAGSIYLGALLCLSTKAATGFMTGVPGRARGRATRSSAILGDRCSNRGTWRGEAATADTPRGGGRRMRSRMRLGVRQKKTPGAGRMWSGCTGRRGTIICNRFMALPVGAEKPTRLSPKFIDFPISRIRKRSSSGHLVHSFPQFHWQQEASCFGGYKYFALLPLPLPSPSSIRSFLLLFPTTP